MPEVGEELLGPDQLNLAWENHKTQPPDHPQTLWRIRYRQAMDELSVIYTEYFFTHEEVTNKLDRIDEGDLLLVDQYEIVPPVSGQR